MLGKRYVKIYIAVVMAAVLLSETSVAQAAEETYLLDEDVFEESDFEIEDYIEECDEEASTEESDDWQDDQYEIIEDITVEEDEISENEVTEEVAAEVSTEDEVAPEEEASEIVIEDATEESSDEATTEASDDGILDMEEDQTTVAKAAKDNKLVTSIEIRGQDYIAAGAKATFKAVVTPSKAKNKKVTWDFDKEYQGVSIGKSSGKVKVAKDVKPGTKITIMAKVLDQSGVSATKTFTIKEKAKSITLETPETTTIATKKIGNLKTEVTLKASIDNGEEVAWKVSAPKKVSITSKDNKATVTAIAPGKVTVTAYANDGSGIKAKVKLNVVIPASSLELTVPEDRLDNLLCSGGKLKFKPVLGNEYGEPSIKKINWDYEIVGYTDRKSTKEKEIPIDSRRKIKKKKYFFTLKNGKVTAVDQAKFKEQGIDLWDTCKCNNYGIKVTATTTDGTNLSVTKLIKRVDRNTYIRTYVGTEFELSTGEVNLLPIRIYGEHDLNKLYVVNKREDIALVMADDANYLKIKGRSKGKVRVLIKTMDGSNLKLYININVK